jgi:hypothetical protein
MSEQNQTAENVAQPSANEVFDMIESGTLDVKSEQSSLEQAGNAETNQEPSAEKSSHVEDVPEWKKAIDEALAQRDSEIAQLRDKLRQTEDGVGRSVAKLRKRTQKIETWAKDMIPEIKRADFISDEEYNRAKKIVDQTKANVEEAEKFYQQEEHSETEQEKNREIESTVNQWKSNNDKLSKSGINVAKILDDYGAIASKGIMIDTEIRDYIYDNEIGTLILAELISDQTGAKLQNLLKKPIMSKMEALIEIKNKVRSELEAKTGNSTKPKQNETPNQNTRHNPPAKAVRAPSASSVKSIADAKNANDVFDLIMAGAKI